MSEDEDYQSYLRERRTRLWIRAAVIVGAVVLIMIIVKVAGAQTIGGG